MRFRTKTSTLCLLIGLAALVSPFPARAGILIETTEVQPVGDPYYNLYLNLSIQGVLSQGDYVLIQSIPYIGLFGANIDQTPYNLYLGGLNLFYNRFDTPTSDFYGSFIFQTFPNTTELKIIYTGIYQKQGIPFFAPKTITTGNTTLTVPLNTLGIRTKIFKDDLSAQDLTFPLVYTSSTTNPDGPGKVTFTSSVVPTVLEPVPEPSTLVAVLSGLPLVFVAYRRMRPVAKIAA